MLLVVSLLLCILLGKINIIITKRGVTAARMQIMQKRACRSILHYLYESRSVIYLSSALYPILASASIICSGVALSVSTVSIFSGVDVSTFQLCMLLLASSTGFTFARHPPQLMVVLNSNLVMVFCFSDFFLVTFNARFCANEFEGCSILPIRS